jgi:hypothetical protein
VAQDGRFVRVPATGAGPREGVESLPQLLFLQQHECHEAQGFLLSKSLNASDAHLLLRRVADLSDGSRSQRLKALLG